MGKWEQAEKKKVRKITRRLAGINHEIQRIVERIVQADETTKVFWGGIRRDLRKQYEKLRKVSREWAQEELPKIYNAAISDQIRATKSTAIGRMKSGGVTYTKMVQSNLSAQSVNSIVQDFKSVLNIGLNQGEKTINRLISVTQQILIDESEINKQVAKGIKGTKGSVNRAKKNVFRKLSKKALDGKTITVVDKNGKQRQYTVKSYSELVARTKATEAQTMAATNTALRVGGDLVQVSSHNTTTPICQKFEGKTYSISGDDPDFPTLTDTPPFHPNCLHSLTVVFREVLEARGIEKYVDFSQAKTEEHPTRTKHTPVSERSA